MVQIFPHVETGQLEQLEARLEEQSNLSGSFLVLLAGSSLIATLGLFQNSPAVIIGAMIVAPLMRPIVGLSLAGLTADRLLLRRALFTIMVGTLFAVFLAMGLAHVLGHLSVTAEILGRTKPTLLDLGVAFVAGSVGAYCQTDDKLVDSLAGVAIAVALVPPLSVVGIGLAFGRQEIWSGALLLYATNLVGIAFAGALVFLVMGYSPLKQAGRGLAISGSILGLLMIPLGFSMYELVLENVLSKKIETVLKERTHTFKGLSLEDVEVRRFKRPMVVTATVSGADVNISSTQVGLVQEFLKRETNVEVDFRLRIIPSREVRAYEVTPSGNFPLPVEITLPLVPSSVEKEIELNAIPKLQYSSPPVRLPGVLPMSSLDAPETPTVLPSKDK